MKWSESDIEVLEEEYERVPTPILSDKLNRSEQAIRKKAERMGLSKRQNHKLLWRIETNEEMRVGDEEFAEYVRGLVDGEGTFTTKGDSKYRFGIEMVSENKELLEKVMKFFDAGYITEYDAREDNWSSTVKYDVTGFEDLVLKIIPFFDDYTPRAPEKREQYESWRAEVLSDVPSSESFNTQQPKT